MRRQVCRRLRARLRELDLPDLAAYRRLLDEVPAEWQRLDDCCRITISRFYRDVRVWEVLGREVLPVLFRRAAERDPPSLRIWSAGAGAGEEPYTVAILLRLGPAPLPPAVEARIFATDLDAHQLQRARRAIYPESSLRDLPAEWRRSAFSRQTDGRYRLAERYRRAVELRLQDIRSEVPEGPFDLILCRNLVFTYFDPDLQARWLRRALTTLAPHGFLVVGSHERLPPSASELVPLPHTPAIVRR